MKLLILILISIVFSGCVSYKGIKLSAFTFNSKKANSKIANRFPDYGDGHKDGCLVMAESNFGRSATVDRLPSEFESHHKLDLPSVICILIESAKCVCRVQQLSERKFQWCIRRAIEC